MKAGRYLLNTKSGIIHDMRRLSERCNTDQIPRRHRKRYKSLSKPISGRGCQWCLAFPARFGRS